MTRRGRYALAVAMAVVLVAAGIVAALSWPRGDEPGQGLPVPSHGGDVGPQTDPTSPATPTRTPDAAALASPFAFVTSVDAGGRAFLDQRGQPVLVRGDSPWSLMTDLSPEEAETYLRTRAAQGFNAVLVSLVGAVDNGAPHDDGTTFDGVAPFVGGDVTRWNDPYWQRARDYVDLAARHGITVFAYPVDGWTIGHAFTPRSLDECQAYGTQVGEWFADAPNIVWVTGGDYFPQTNEPQEGSDVDHCFDSVRRGIRDTGDGRPLSIQLGYDTSVSTDNPFWASRIDWNFVYTYYPTYRAVLDAYEAAPIPALMGEGNYEGENNQADTPGTTTETLRRQVLWALTSGATGDFFGTDDWEFHEGWADRLDSPGATAVNTARDILAGLKWWELVPDTADRLVVQGRGTPVQDDKPRDVLDSDYATAAATGDGTQAVVYVPTSRTVRLDLGVLAPGVTATWVDPTSAREVPAGPGPEFTTPGRNGGGDEDWLLILR